MADLPTELLYLSSHEWVKLVSDDVATIGITDHAQQLLGDVVFVELPEIGMTLAAGAEAGVVESVKAASDIYAPLTGEVIQVNQVLVDEPDIVNRDPYNDGWFFKIQLKDTEELKNLMDYDSYAAYLASEH